MKVLITMAGKGSRFKEVGVSRPKHEIPVKGKPMFDWAMKSLEAFFDEDFIFVTYSGHSPSSFIKDACSRLGISNFEEITISKHTSGQATTALKANKVIPKSESVAIYNIDTYIEGGQLQKPNISGDGWIPVFKTTGDHWSFVETDENGAVKRVSEKKRISDLATVGFYYFDRWDYFVEAYNSEAREVEKEFGEIYIAPLYNYMIQSNLRVEKKSINEKKVHGLGTPKDLSNFDSGFDPEYI